MASISTRYKINPDGTIEKNRVRNDDTKNIIEYPYTDIFDAQNEVAKKQQESLNTIRDTYEKRISDLTSQENTRNSLASQIQALTAGGTGMQNPNAGPAFNQALSQLSADRNYGSSDLGSRLNFQDSDQNIVDDYNNSKLSRLNSVI